MCLGHARGKVFADSDKQRKEMGNDNFIFLNGSVRQHQGRRDKTVRILAARQLGGTHRPGRSATPADPQPPL